MLFTQHTCKGVGILFFLVLPKVCSCSFVVVVISRGESAAREIESNVCVDVVTTKHVCLLGNQGIHFPLTISYMFL